MDEQDRRPHSRMAHPQLNIPNRNALIDEALEHRRLVPDRRNVTPVRGSERSLVRDAARPEIGLNKRSNARRTVPAAIARSVAAPTCHLSDLAKRSATRPKRHINDMWPNPIRNDTALAGRPYPSSS
ncbi:hypothetical protein GCM10012284_52920 [Mangrovihabitans endophyticus]|uniref:Uncharacterized protein n=1 Tax=Mangrovihabitans endophyticus TaxID=1751298 RepID=A0A8J3C3Y4_9ACTN|nr:hypothetical protein GCM10012284_52920 [Mangrovihabitans endophyticus]